MIYLMDEQMYPESGMHLEEHTYKDENSFEWRIARVKNGFFVRYLGDKYFSDTFFSVDTPSGTVNVFNTNNIFIQDESFDTFYEFREILKTGYTDDIWDIVKGLLEERFLHDAGLLKSEMCGGKI